MQTDLVSRETHDTHSASNGTNGTAPASATPLKTAADWAGATELYSLLSELQEIPVCASSYLTARVNLIRRELPQETDNARIRDLLAKETKLEMDRKRNGIIETEDLITPSKKLWALATLYSSLVRPSIHSFDHLNSRRITL